MNNDSKEIITETDFFDLLYKSKVGEIRMQRITMEDKYFALLWTQCSKKDYEKIYDLEDKTSMKDFISYLRQIFKLG